MELPEDEFWFFEGFRPALSSLSVEPPAFLHEMAFVNLYAAFDGFVSDLLRARLQRHPQMMGGERQLRYEEIFGAPNKEALLERMIEREVRDVMYQALTDVLATFRGRFGMTKLGSSRDAEAQRIALTRNCLLHNAGLVDSRLARVAPERPVGERIVIGHTEMSDACNVLRKLAYEIDRADQGFAAG
ncbi:MAG: hypothetical protein ACK4F1_15200 [Phenylobacterium sp.]